MRRFRQFFVPRPTCPHRSGRRAVSLGNPGDPIEYLKALSADADGREILAVLLEVLEAGFTHSGEGTSEELYVWPYFAEYPLQALTSVAGFWRALRFLATRNS